MVFPAVKDAMDLKGKGAPGSASQGLPQITAKKP